MGPRHFLEAAVLPCSNDKPRVESAACDDQIVRHGYPQKDFSPNFSRTVDDLRASAWATLAERMERDSVVGAHGAPFRQDLSRKKGFSRSFEPPLESSRRT